MFCHTKYGHIGWGRLPRNYGTQSPITSQPLAEAISRRPPPSNAFVTIR